MLAHVAKKHVWPQRKRASVPAGVMKRRLVSTSVFLLMMLCYLSPAQGQEPTALRLTQTIALPKVQGGFNHMSVDAGDQRLFAPAPTNKTLEIVDLRSGKPWRSLKGERPTAALYAPEFGQLYLTSGQSVYIYNRKTLDAVARVDLHTRLDQLRYDARPRELYVGCMTEGKTGVAVIAIPEGKLLGKVPLPTSPQGIAVEKNGRRIFANLPALSSIAVIDRRERKVLEMWSLHRAQDNFPMALVEKDHRLFVTCRTPAEMLVLDTQSGRIIARVPCVRDADDMWYDEARKRIYVSGGEGFVSVIKQQGTDRYRILNRIATTRDAATSIFSGELNSLFVGVPRTGNEPAEILVYRAGR